MERQPVRFLARELERHARRGAARGRRVPQRATPTASRSCPTRRRASRPSWRRSASSPATSCWPATTSTTRRSTRCARPPTRDGATLMIVRDPVPDRTSRRRPSRPILDAVTPRTRSRSSATSRRPTALVLPIGAIVRELAAAGSTRSSTGRTRRAWSPSTRRARRRVLDGNAHKWLCAPEGRRRCSTSAPTSGAIRPLVISHGANAPRTDRSRFRLEFDWTGTATRRGASTLPAAIRFVGGLDDGGWPGYMAANRSMARAAGTCSVRRSACRRPRRTR